MRPANRSAWSGARLTTERAGLKPWKTRLPNYCNDIASRPVNQAAKMAEEGETSMFFAPEDHKVSLFFHLRPIWDAGLGL